MKKFIKAVLCILTIAAAAACVAYLIIRYQEQITEFIDRLREKFGKKVEYTDAEYDDFADI